MNTQSQYRTMKMKKAGTLMPKEQHDKRRKAILALSPHLDTRQKRVKALSDAMEKLATRAGELDLRLSNGGFVDSWLSEIANEILEVEGLK